MNYQTDRQWSDKFLPMVKALIGPYLLKNTPNEIDWKEAADLMVLTAAPIRVAVRVRRAGYAERYPNEITIRSRRDSGNETELSKIIDGWGDWLFYAHSNAQETGFDRWWLVDLRILRASLIRNANNKGDDCPPLIWHNKSNNDGTYFRSFDLTSFPDQRVVIAGSDLTSLPQTVSSTVRYFNGRRAS